VQATVLAVLPPKPMLQYGATVLLLGRDLKKLDAVYDEIEAAGYAQPAIIPLILVPNCHGL
jgi:short-subunit dehydrogenase